jgi:hypothetical protein
MPDKAKDGREMETRKLSIYDKSIDSSDTATEYSRRRPPTWQDGAIGTGEQFNDHYPMPVHTSDTDWMKQRKDQQRLRRHTFDQGHATFTKEDF